MHLQQQQQQQYQTPACLEGSTKRKGTAKVSTFCIRMIAASTLSLFPFSTSAFYFLSLDVRCFLYVTASAGFIWIPDVLSAV